MSDFVIWRGEPMKWRTKFLGEPQSPMMPWHTDISKAKIFTCLKLARHTAAVCEGHVSPRDFFTGKKPAAYQRGFFFTKNRQVHGNAVHRQKFAHSQWLYPGHAQTRVLMLDTAEYIYAWQIPSENIPKNRVFMHLDRICVRCENSTFDQAKSFVEAFFQNPILTLDAVDALAVEYLHW